MTHRRRLANVLGVAPLIAGLLVTSGAPAEASSAWQPAPRLGLGGAADIACPTATVCWALSGGELLSSSDGGTSWTTVSDRVPAEVDVLDALDCPRADTCYLAGRQPDRSPVLLRLAPVGDLVVPVASQQHMSSVSCSTASRCIATDDSSVYGTSDSGATWTQLGTPPLAYTAAVSCAPNSKRCWAAGSSYPNAQVARSLDGGLTWRLQQQVDGIGSFQGIDCPSTTICLTVGQHGLAGVLYYTHDGGATWSLGALPARTNPLHSVACGSVATCEATGGPFGSSFIAAFAIGSSDGGASWHRQTLGGSPAGASAGGPVVSCGSADSCAAVTRAGLGFSTTSAGASWSQVPLPAGLDGAWRVDCPSASLCIALAQDELYRLVAMISSDAGVTWSRRVIGASSGYPNSFECASPTTCSAVIVTTTYDGQHTTTVGRIVYTTDAGASWRTNDSTPVPSLRAMSCPTTTSCLGIGTTAGGRPVLLRTTDAFAHWQKLIPPPATARLAAVTCASTTACTVTAVPTGGTVASAAEFSADLGDSFRVTTLPDSGSGFASLDCAGLTCYAVANTSGTYGGIVVKSSDGGASWRRQSVPAHATRLRLVACSTALVCAISADSGNQHHSGAEVLTSAAGGRPWSVQPLPPPQEPFTTAVACAGPTCMEFDVSANGTVRVVRGMP